MLDIKKFELELQEISKKIRKEDSENTTFLSVIESEYKENVITSFLKFILDPNQNGIGWLPLNKLLEILDISYEFTDEDLEYIDISQEYGIKNNRRIDLVIKTRELWIVIENKINAWEQINQTKDYFEYIENIKEDEDVVYIYLKPNYNKSEPDKDTDFKSLIYSDFIKKLEEITIDDYIDKEKYKFLNEFIKHSRRYFMQETQVDFANEYVEFYIKNKESINKITKVYSEESQRLYKIFQEMIKNKLNQNATDEFLGKGQRWWFPLYRKSWGDVLDWVVHYEILVNDFLEILGKKSVEIRFSVHVEKEASKYIDIFKEEGVEHRIGEFTKKYDFTTNKEFEESTEDIVNDLRKLDKEYGEKIQRSIERIKDIKEKDKV